MIDTQLQASYDEMCERVSRIQDGMGEPVDSGIFEIVVLLNLFDIRTTWSCEGHRDRSFSPWIAVSAPRNQGLEEKVERARDEAKKVLRPDSQELSQEEAAAIDRLNALSLELKKHQIVPILRLFDLLSAFYVDRHISFDQQLSLRPVGNGGVRLESNGAVLQDVRLEAERGERLAIYQQEMQAFTRFLKSWYFAQAKQPVSL